MANGTSRSGWFEKALVTGAAMGVTGLLVAGSTLGKVDDLDQASKTQGEAVIEIKEDVAALKTNIDAILDEQSKVREEYRDDQREINRKLDRLLEQRSN